MERRKINNLILINIIVLFVSLLLIEPTNKTDDYDMLCTLYGGMSGEYSPYMLYSNVIFGEICVFLLELFPNVAWYYVLQYFLMVSANIVFLCALNEETSKNNHDTFKGICLGKEFVTYPKTKMFLYYIWLIIFSYEFYIRITFSKTAGFLTFIGYICFYFYIKTQKKMWIVPGIFYIFWGIIIRPSFYLMITIIMFFVFLIFVFESLKKLFDHKLDKKIVITYVAKFIIIAMSTYIFYILLGDYNSYRYSKDELWSNYTEENVARATLVDYGIPDYNEYKDEYANLGVSQNDFKFWFTYGIRGDSSRLTSELYNEIGLLREDSDNSCFDEIALILKDVIPYLMSQSFFILFIVYAYCLVEENKKNLIKVIAMLAAVLIVFVYLKLIGRITHHIDVVLFSSVDLILLMYIQKYNLNFKKLISLLSVSLVFIIITNYTEIVSSSYDGRNFDSFKGRVEENFEELNSLSNDKEHLYVIHPQYSELLFISFSMFEVIPKNFYSNIWRPNVNHAQAWNVPLDNYSVENIWREATDSNIIRFVCTKNIEEQITCVEQYIQENYNKNAKAHIIHDDGKVLVYEIVSQ